MMRSLIGAIAITHALKSMFLINVVVVVNTENLS